MNERKSINLARKRPLTKREIEANRAALAAKIAQMQPSMAIVAPPRCMDLREVGFVAGSTAHGAQRGPGRKVEMTTAVKAKANGTPQVQKAAAKKTRRLFSDEDIREIYAECLSNPDDAERIYKNHHISRAAFYARLKKMSLPTPHKVKGSAVMSDPGTPAAEPVITAPTPPVEAPVPAWLNGPATDAAQLELMPPAAAEAGAGDITAQTGRPRLAEVLAFLGYVEQSGLPVTVSGRVSLRIEVEL